MVLLIKPQLCTQLVGGQLHGIAHAKGLALSSKPFQHLIQHGQAHDGGREKEGREEERGREEGRKEGRKIGRKKGEDTREEEKKADHINAKEAN